MFGKNKLNLPLIAIFAVALVLRLYKLNSLMIFDQDHAWYFLQAKDLVVNGNIPLVGIPTSVPVLKQGALWSWVLAPVLWLGNFNPAFGGYLTAVFGVTSVYLTYKLVSGWYGKQTGMIAGLVSAVLPFLVITDRVPYVLAPAFTFILVASYFFDKAYRKGGVSYLFFGLSLAAATQFLLGAFIIFPIFLATFIIKRAKISLKEIMAFFAGAFAGFLPFYIHDLLNGAFIQTAGFVLWFFGKPFEFLFVPGTRAEASFFDLAGRATEMLVFPSYYLPALVILGLAVLIFTIEAASKKDNLGYQSVLIIVWLFASLISFSLRGIFSYAFLPTIAFPVVVIVSFAFSYLIKKWKVLGIAAISIYLSANTYFLFKNDFSYQGRLGNRVFVVKNVSEHIVVSSGSKSVELNYIGPGDHFASGDNHFHYYLWLLGKEPDRNAELVYYIYTEDVELNYSFKDIKDFGYYKVGVKQND